MGVDARSRGEYYRGEAKVPSKQNPARLFRRLCHQQTDLAQFLVGKDDPLALVVVLHVTQTGGSGVAAKVRFRQSQEHRRAMLVDAIVHVSVHVKPTGDNLEQARSQST